MDRRRIYYMQTKVKKGIDLLGETIELININDLLNDKFDNNKHFTKMDLLGQEILMMKRKNLQNFSEKLNEITNKPKTDISKYNPDLFNYNRDF
jgi:hypothetical protein